MKNYCHIVDNKSVLCYDFNREVNKFVIIVFNDIKAAAFREVT